MYRQLRSDKMIGTLEKLYRVNLNTRPDTLLGNLLNERGFDSWTQLLEAYYGNAKKHARKRRLFISFHAEDIKQIQGFRLMSYNESIQLDYYDLSVTEAINSEKSSYVRAQIKQKIQNCSVLVCLIGNGTAWREWVDWEIRTAKALRKGICGVKLKGSRAQVPHALIEYSVPIWDWGVENIVAAIECAAATRS